MARRGGWRREGRKGRFRYVDARGRRITDREKLERIDALVIPPAWRNVWISPRPRAKLQATGVDSAGRRQYLYHAEFRAQQEREKFDKLVRFAERLPELRKTMSKHIDGEPLSPEWTCALAVRLINLGWFRVGTERYARTTKTFGITTLRKSHVTVRGNRISFRYRGKNRARVRTAIVDEELADAMKELLQVRGGRGLFRYQGNGSLTTLTGARLNEYIDEHMGDEFTAKDFRTWGGTLIAAISLGEHGPAESETEAKRVVAGVMRAVGEQLGNTAAVARSSYVSPAVVEQYLDGRTIEDFRPFCAPGAQKASADGASRPQSTFALGEERAGAPVIYASSAHAIQSRSRGASPAQPAALVANSAGTRCRVNFLRLSATLPRTRFRLREGNLMARKTVLVCDNCGREVGEGKGATMRLNYTDARRGSKQADLCDNCAGQMPGRAAARRGRRPKAASGR